MTDTKMFGLATTATTNTTTTTTSSVKSENINQYGHTGGRRFLESAAPTGRKPATKSLTTTTAPTQQQQQQHNQQQLLQNIVKPNDTLEYIIKFPTPQYRNEQNNGFEQTAGEADDFVFVYNDTHVPIVMLLGWAGCQDRYLMKYSKIYEDRGLITVRYTAPVDTLFWKRREMGWSS
uniref:Transmembrane protein 53 n=1 Tax=Musca domestica TaxID=7370 RepID=A0A1I8MIF2_MUSDO